MQQSEVILARYRQTEREADDLGRLIYVRRMRPSEETKLAGMTAELSGYDEGKNDNGEFIRVPHRFPMILAASVCQIDEDRIPFPRNRGELDAIYDRLDIEGIAAATKAYARLRGFISDTPPEPAPDLKDEAKNS